MGGWELVEIELYHWVSARDADSEEGRAGREDLCSKASSELLHIRLERQPIHAHTRVPHPANPRPHLPTTHGADGNDARLIVWANSTFQV